MVGERISIVPTTTNFRRCKLFDAVCAMFVILCVVAKLRTLQLESLCFLGRYQLCILIMYLRQTRLLWRHSTRWGTLARADGQQIEMPGLLRLYSSEPRERMDYDVCVVGAGPSGLSAAIKIKQVRCTIHRH